MSAVAQSAAPRVDRRTQNLVFATVVLGLLLAALDQTIVSTAPGSCSSGSGPRG